MFCGIHVKVCAVVITQKEAAEERTRFLGGLMTKRKMGCACAFCVREEMCEVRNDFCCQQPQ